MADFPGELLDLTPLAASPAPLPHTGGKVTVLGARRVEPVAALEAADFADGAFTAAGSVAPPSPSPAALVGEKSDLTPGVPWFDHVHVLPRTSETEPLDFGNLVTTVTADFELFNAYGESVTYTTFSNGAGAGVTVPNLGSPTIMLGPYQSFLDPSSTRLSPVKLKVQADPEGPATIDGSLDFTFSPGGTLELFVSGNRIVLVPFDYEHPFSEGMDFGVEVLTREDGSHQRIAPRGEWPRQDFDFTYRLDDYQKRRLRLLLFDWQGRLFAVPLKHERMRIEQAVSSGVVVTVDDTSDVDLRVGGLAVVFKDDDTNDVLTVVGKTATTITFASAVQNSYAVGDFVYPARLCRASTNIRGSRPPVNAEDFRVLWSVDDNQTGALTGDLSTFSSYDSQLLLDDCNVVNGSVSVSRKVAVARLDNQIGAVFEQPLWERNKRSHAVTLVARTRAELIRYKRMLVALRGQQIPFYVPTHDDDLIPTQDVTSGSAILDVVNDGYTRYAQQRQGVRDIRATFTDGTTIEREIINSAELSATEERLTLDANWGVDKTVEEFVRVEFLERVHVSGKRVRIQHQRVGLARLVLPVTEVFDS